MSLFKEISRYGLLFVMLLLSQSDPGFWDRLGLGREPAAFAPIDLAGALRHLRHAGGERVAVIDARSHAQFLAGHIPGARSMQEIPRTADACAPFAGDDVLIVYCDNSLCPRAEVVAARLGSFLHARLYVYAGGWEEWASSGLPVER